VTVKVLLDSNFLFIPVQFKVDIFREMERLLVTRVKPILPSPVYEEVRSLALGGSSKISRQATLALKLAERCEVLETDRRPEETVDDYILRVARSLGCVVATADGELRKRLRAINIPVIYLRNKSYLAVDGGVPNNCSS